MQKIPASLRKLLSIFLNKEATKPLNERQALKTMYAREKRPEGEVDLDNPSLKKALKLHYLLEEREKAIWNKFEKEVMNNAAVEQIPEIKQPARIKGMTLRQWIAAAVIVSVVSTVVFYIYRGKQKDLVAYHTEKSGYRQIRQLKLPDGSVVTLNALSDITYPADFTEGEERHVVLIGEAFFSVHPDPDHPFRVNALNATVAALGTRFNVKAYPEEKKVTTTLLSGVISVSSGNDHILLRDSGQAVVEGDRAPRIIQYANYSNVLRWSDKTLMLEGEALPSVMWQIKRYYNVQISIEKGLQVDDLTGYISIPDSLSELLNTLNEVSDDVFFEFDGKTVFARKK